MSAKELKEQTIGDAKFWLGLLAFMLTLGTVVWKGGENAAKLDEVVAKLNRIEPMLERVTRMEARIDNFEQHFNRLEYHPGSASSQPMWQYDKQP